jgi:hypothetical protein
VRGTNTGECTFCGLLHYICNCATALEYIKVWKYKRNGEGKAVLPNRSFVQHDILGCWLKNRVKKMAQAQPRAKSWHK